MNYRFLLGLAILLIGLPTILGAQAIVFPNRGGTGTSTIPTEGDLLVGQTSGQYGILPVGSNGQVLKVSGGNIVWGTDLQGAGGGGSGLFATTSPSDDIVYPINNRGILVGATATSSDGIFEVNGNSTLEGDLTVTSTTTLATTTLTGNINTGHNRLVMDNDGDSYLVSNMDDDIQFFIGGNESEVFNSTQVAFNEDGSDRDFRIEGSGEEDAFFIQGSDGKAGMGTQNPTAQFEVLATGSSDPTSDWFANTTGGVASLSDGDQTSNLTGYAGDTADDQPIFFFRRSRGTLDSPFIVNNGDDVFTMIGSAYDGDEFQNTAEIKGVIDGATSNNTIPQALSFQTGDTTSRSERMRITSDGDVSVGDTDSTQAFNVQNSSGQNLIEADTTNGKFVVRQPGGTAGTDEVQISYDGSGEIKDLSGNLRITTNSILDFYAGGANMTRLSVNVFQPNQNQTLGNSSNRWSTLYTDNTLDVELANSGNKGAVIQGASSQTANLTEWQDSSSNVLSAVGNNGYIGAATSSPEAPLHAFDSGTGRQILVESDTSENSTGEGGTVEADGVSQFYSNNNNETAAIEAAGTDGGTESDSRYSQAEIAGFSNTPLNGTSTAQNYGVWGHSYNFGGAGVIATYGANYLETPDNEAYLATANDAAQFEGSVDANGNVNISGNLTVNGTVDRREQVASISKSTSTMPFDGSLYPILSHESLLTIQKVYCFVEGNGIGGSDTVDFVIEDSVGDETNQVTCENTVGTGTDITTNNVINGTEKANIEVKSTSGLSNIDYIHIEIYADVNY